MRRGTRVGEKLKTYGEFEVALNVFETFETL